ncbi:TetR/AcrR family transcriptional regulator [Paraburkholderia azotifigens]|uniref:TetR/AcrR family transcriptional regulator n=1 Tax=Paraburkholderia azotifigens TaxID=2057004 RepID=A0A5C6V8L6_9BURK|nr:TetR/AcrR family transcriptional regulator [Paraburkholderia azotifigens]TXC81084.1 TetR/AcrR family transcriptional regulator [Paraburkholderia azotifigens]
MARPREFDEAAALDAAVEHFWLHGYQSTSIRELASAMGITGASLYNAFGDKRALFKMALGRYIETGIEGRVIRERQSTVYAIDEFFTDIVNYSIKDKSRKGCLLVNSALELGDEDTELKGVVSDVFVEIEAFFRRAIAAGQKHGEVSTALPAADLARLLLGALLGIRVLARVRPNRLLLEGIARSALLVLKR